MAYFGHVFGCSCFRCSWLALQPTLPRKSKNLPRRKPRIQEPAEDKAENKIRTDAYKKTRISKLCSSKLLSLSQTSLLQKLGRRYSPPGGLQSAAQSGRRVERFDPGLLVFPSPPPWTKFLTQRFWEPERLAYPSLILPTGHCPTLSCAAICGVFASWRLLGRKNRVPRGLQKLIKF